MKHCFAYTRVSTAGQEDGASLLEQENIISRYAERQGLLIVEWFREVETAAKPGRPVFGKMMKLLRRKKAEGLIMHKIDRSSRNFHDWAQVNELADSGIAVHFAGENLELSSRGRRLMADIQVVFATDYIRNLKEEIRKGIDGRLREGLITWRAPLGYLDNGKGQKKTICPLKGPLVEEAFREYASGRHTLHSLSKLLWQRGLRNQREGRLTVSGLANLLKNPFYIGLICCRKSGMFYNGIHEPLISRTLFDRVGERLQGKTAQKVKKHSFTYRRMFRCRECNHFLIPERQKGHAYYRCHTRTCSRPSVREEAIEEAVVRAFGALAVTEKVREQLETYVANFLDEHEKLARETREVWKCQLGAIEARENRLVDVYLEGALDRETFEKRKSTLLFERKDIEEKLRKKENPLESKQRLRQILELAFTASLGHETATDAEKRERLEILSSNRIVDRKNVVIELSFPFSLLAFRGENQSGAPLRTSSRSGRKLPQPQVSIPSGAPLRTSSRSSRTLPQAAHSLDRRLRHVVEDIYNWLASNPNQTSRLLS